MIGAHTGYDKDPEWQVGSLKWNLMSRYPSESLGVSPTGSHTFMYRQAKQSACCRLEFDVRVTSTDWRWAAHLIRVLLMTRHTWSCLVILLVSVSWENGSLASSSLPSDKFFSLKLLWVCPEVFLQHVSSIYLVVMVVKVWTLLRQTARVQMLTCCVLFRNYFLSLSFLLSKHSCFEV